MTDSYVTFLVLGVLLVVIDGQLIYRSGKGYLRPESTEMVRLVAVLFHLIMLGLLALVSLIEIETGDPFKNVVANLGVVLLLLALAHGVTMAIFGRIRDRQLQQQMADEMTEEHRIYDERQEERQANLPDGVAARANGSG